ncbi:MAG: superoxide dismutase [Bacillus sp. (in: firmicutes)]
MEKYLAYLKDVENWVRGLESQQGVINNQNIINEMEQIKGSLSAVNREVVTAEQIWAIQQQADRLEKLARNEAGKATLRAGVPIGQHTLPPLPYPYDALEPYISAEIMRLHHDKHHKSYVDGLNKAELNMRTARETGDFSLLKHWEREAAFHGSGHYLHIIFWNVMNPKGGGEPTGPLLAQIRKDFGSYKAFKKHFSEAAKQVEGVGWALLVWSLRSGRLEILQSERHMLLTQWDTIPILVLDVWEHAYYLDYKNDRGRYVDRWWNIVYWPEAEARFAKARQLVWQPY